METPNYAAKWEGNELEDFLLGLANGVATPAQQQKAAFLLVQASPLMARLPSTLEGLLRAQGLTYMEALMKKARSRRN